MREILFRGKTKDEANEWVEGCNINTQYDMHGEKHIYIGLHCESKFYPLQKCVRWIEVIPETVSQFVYFTDKNGKNIFEGDIVKDEYGRILEVVFREHLGKFSFMLVKTTGEKWTNNFAYAEIFEWFLSTTIYPEVIGNIYDNPELLEVKE